MFTPVEYPPRQFPMQNNDMALEKRIIRNPASVTSCETMIVLLRPNTKDDTPLISVPMIAPNRLALAKRTMNYKLELGY